MDDKRENRIVWAFFVVFITIIAVSLLCGCKTKTVTITETVYVHDTVTNHKTDTLIDIRVKTDSVIEYKLLTLNDTTIIERGSVVVLKENGDTLKQSEWEKTWQKIKEKENVQHNESHSDSINLYKAQNDSLRKALNIEKAKEKTVIKRYYIPWWLIATLVIIFIGLYIYVLTHYRKKYSNN